MRKRFRDIIAESCVLAEVMNICMDGYISGEISSINVTTNGERMDGYHFKIHRCGPERHIRFRDRTGASEGHLESREFLYLRSSAKEEVTREVSKPHGNERYVFDFYEIGLR